MDDYTHILKERLRELEQTEGMMSHLVGHLEAVAESDYTSADVREFVLKLMELLENKE